MVENREEADEIRRSLVENRFEVDEMRGYLIKDQLVEKRGNMVENHREGHDQKRN